MALDSGISSRFIVPRWRLTDDPIGAAEQVISGASNRTIDSNAFNEWRANKNIATASEAICAALVAGKNHEFTDAAQYVLKSKDASPEQKRIAKIITGKITDDEPSHLPITGIKYRNFIHEYKIRLRINPINPMLWLDQAYAYLCLGQTDKSIDCATIAHSLCPNNRVILRSIARLWHHLNDPDKALFYLRSSPLLKIDPWVCAAEIAISSSADIKSVSAKRAISLLNSGGHSPDQITELSSALASLELSNGKDKNAKELFKRSLLRPNENSLAQAQAAKIKIGADFTKLNKEIPGSYEAVSRLNYTEDRLDESLKTSKYWQADQPFSVSPALFSSYIASVGMGNYKAAISILDESLALSPNNFMLHNNKSFSLASIGKAEEAKRELDNIAIETLDDTEKAILCATTGLIYYREGKRDIGEKYYLHSVLWFKKFRDNKSFLSCAFWLREEMLCNGNNIRKAYEFCMENSAYISDPSAKRLWKQLKKDAETHLGSHPQKPS